MADLQRYQPTRYLKFECKNRKSDTPLLGHLKLPLLFVPLKSNNMMHVDILLLIKYLLLEGN